MSAGTPTPLDVLRRYAVTSVDGNPTPYDLALSDVETLVKAANVLWTYYLLPLPDDKKEQVRAALARFAGDGNERAT